MRAFLASGIRLPLIVLAAVLFFYAILHGDPYTLRILTLAGVYALLVIGYQIIFG